MAHGYFFSGSPLISYRSFFLSPHTKRDREVLLFAADRIWATLSRAIALTIGDYLTTPGQPAHKDLEMIRDAGFVLEAPDGSPLEGAPLSYQSACFSLAP